MACHVGWLNWTGWRSLRTEMSFWKLRNEVKLRLKSFEDEIDYFICLCAPLNFLSSSDTAQVGGWSSELQFKRVQSYSPQRCSAQAYLPDDRFFSSSRSLCSDLLMSIWDYLLQHQTELYACNSGRNYSIHKIAGEDYSSTVAQRDVNYSDFETKQYQLMQGSTR